MDHSSSASASASNSATAATGASDVNELLDKPLWKYVTKIDAIVEGGGNLSWMYNFCKKDFKSSYTRVRAHLLKLSGKEIGKCLMVQNRDLIEMEKLEKETDQRKQSNAPRNVPLPPSSSSTCPKTRKTTGSLEMTFNVGEREELNYLIARMFYSAGSPFNLAKNLTSKLRILMQQIIILEVICHRDITHCEPLCCKRRKKILISCVNLFERLGLIKGETNDKNLIFRLLKEVIQEVGETNVVQVITDNAANCKGAGQLIEQEFSSITWTPCVVHTLNLTVKNICAAKNVESNQITYEECSWISNIVGDVVAIKHFIMNHSMRLAIFNEFVSLKLLSIADTRFASMIVMLKRFNLIKSGLQNMVISEKWNIYRDDNLGRARHVKEKLLDDCFWDSVDYILAFTAPIYDMIRACDTDRACLHLIYDMWDTMIVKVEKANTIKRGGGWKRAPLFMMWCIAFLYYSQQWLQEDSSRVPPHMDLELTQERQKCLRRFFPSMEDRSRISLEYADFISNSGTFGDFDAINSTQYTMDPKSWNKITPKHAEDLVYVHSNLRLLSRKTPSYAQGANQMWDIAGDTFDSLDDIGDLQFASLSLDEPEIEAMIIQDGDENN
ncbi:uncharacterized protein LOC133297483 [Gastrolobium bilobum]|uniref:uncharacterized protein LOC133297483 n=1 Tax=Gastrolobium bilobum TaxID=150636 RepID=UPI002AAFB6BA|nr:uncharacterized protein LOC133297483 [Gastrolobium bilobum]